MQAAIAGRGAGIAAPEQTMRRVDRHEQMGAARDALGRPQEQEPPGAQGERELPDNPLLGLENVVLTPHVSWYTADTMRRYLAEGVDNCVRLRDGRELRHVVNDVVNGRF